MAFKSPSGLLTALGRAERPLEAFEGFQKPGAFEDRWEPSKAHGFLQEKGARLKKETGKKLKAPTPSGSLREFKDPKAAPKGPFGQGG